MAMKDWDDVPYGTKDCIRDTAEWNKVVEYIKHSGSCNSGAGHILYDDDDSNEQRFKFSYYGDDSILEGHSLVSKNLTLKANSSNDCPYITLFGNSDILNVIEDVSDFLVKTCSGTELLKVNDTAITYKGAAIGGGGGDCPVKGGVTFTLWANCVAETGERFKFYEHSIDFNADRAIYINDDETYIGHGAGDKVTSGIRNTFVGRDAGHKNTLGECNVATGYGALFSNISGINNTVSGFAALYLNTTGDSITATGYNALYNNTIGRYNTASGFAVLMSNTAGSYNVASGYRTLFSNTIGNSNTAVGYRAGHNSATVDGGVYLGKSAGYNNITANRLYINNSSSVFPLIYGEFDNDIVKFGDNNALFFFKFSHDANDAIVETEAANRSIYLKPHGTGLVKFGTYAAKDAEAFAGYVTMESDDGVSRKVMICA